MSKRIIAIILCAVMLVACFAGCAKKRDENDFGPYITMYLSDDIFDFDPANAYYNTDTLNVVSMLYDTLFTLDDDGDVVKSLAKSYEISTDKRTGEHYMLITLREAFWSNGNQMSADDVWYAWRRLLTSTNDYAAAALLYDIKNARAAKEGEVSIDNVGIEALSVDTLRITFEDEVDYDQFLLNLTSVATAPLLETYVSKNPDWAKKASTIVTSGPFKLGKIFYKDIEDNAGNSIAIGDDYAFNANGEALDYAGNPEGGTAVTEFSIKNINFFYLERNLYYYRDPERSAIDSSVTPYRILVDCTMSAEEILEAYKENKIFYVGSIPLSIRGDEFVKKNVEISNALSTFVCYMNEYAFIDGEYLFADEAVRNALSLAINRDEIAAKVVYAQAATGIVSPGVFNEGEISKNDFRKVGANLITTSPDKDAALALLEEAGVDPADYSFSIKVAAYDDVHVAIVEMIQEAWEELGFEVTVDLVYPIENNDYLKEVGSVPTDVCDDMIVESIQRGTYEVIAFDSNALSANAFSVLSPYSISFSGMAMNVTSDYYAGKNSLGYIGMEYNNLLNAAYYIPYYASIDTDKTEFTASVKTRTPYIEVATALAQNIPSIFQNVNTYLELATPDAVTVRQMANLDDVNATIAKLDRQLTPFYKANKEIINSYAVSGQTYEREAEVLAAIETILASNETVGAKMIALKNATGTAISDATKAYTDTVIAAKETLLNAVAVVLDVAADAEEAAALADATTLYDIIGDIYEENGITPSTKSSDWEEQKAILLHAAEKLLVEEMPVIPVIFNQNAVMISDQISKVSNTYYIPATFRKTKLKNYNDYTYINEKGEKISIFDEFPAVAWDKLSD